MPYYHVLQNLLTSIGTDLLHVSVLVFKAKQGWEEEEKLWKEREKEKKCSSQMYQV